VWDREAATTSRRQALSWAAEHATPAHNLMGASLLDDVSWHMAERSPHTPHHTPAGSHTLATAAMLCRAVLCCLLCVPPLQVKAGQAAPAELQREQEKLGQMDSQLQGLQSNYSRMKDQAAALLQRISSSSSSSSGSGSGAAAGVAAAADGSGKASGAASGITGAVYAGLKFSGLAMRIAADVVSSVTDDAGKMLRVRKRGGGEIGGDGGAAACLVWGVSGEREAARGDGCTEG